MAVTDPLRPLVDAAANGDNRALTELVRCTQPTVWRVCQALGDPADVDDLVQDTYLRALRSLPSYRGDAPVSAWLVAIARNTCADHVRRRQRQRRMVERITPSAEEPPVVAHTDHLHDLLQSLDEDRRDAFVLTQLAGFSYEDAAASLGCPIGTIRSRVARARMDLVRLYEAADAV